MIVGLTHYRGAHDPSAKFAPELDAAAVVRRLRRPDCLGLITAIPSPGAIR